MKKLLIALMGVVAVAGLLTFNTGCKSVVTTDPTTGVVTTNKVVNADVIVPVVQTVVPIAVQIAVERETNAAPYLKAATVVLDALVTSGTYDPASVQAALDGLKVPATYSKEGAMAVEAGLAIYKGFAAQAVTQKLTAQQILPVLKAVSDSIKQGLAWSAAPDAGVSVKVFSVGAAAPTNKVYKVRVQ